jgi:hypothetical protein
MPPGGPRPARVEALIGFLSKELVKVCEVATGKKRKK